MRFIFNKLVKLEKISENKMIGFDNINAKKSII